MPKIRGVKPDTWTDDKFVQLTPLARLLFIGMWNYACDNGHVEDNAVQLKIRLLPMDSCTVAELVDEMVVTGQVERHHGFLKVVKLAEHQHIDMRWLTLCEWCEHDEHTSFKPTQKRPRKTSTRRAQDEQPSGPPRAQDADGDCDGELMVSGGDTPARKPPKKRSTQLPATWQPTEEHKKRASDTGINLDQQATKFRLHAEETGRKAANWNAAFTRWLMNAAEWANPRGSKPAAPARPHVSLIEGAPSGMTDEEYDAWEAEQIRKRRGA